MDTFIDILFIALGIYLAVSGIGTIVRRKPFGLGSSGFARYTDESLQAASPLMGAGLAVLGIAWIIATIIDIIPAFASLNSVHLIIMIAGLVAALPFTILSARKLVEKKK